MSLIAELWIIPQDKLNGLAEASEFTRDSWLWFKWTTDNYYPYLKTHGRELKQEEEIAGIVYDQVIDFLYESLKPSLDENALSDTGRYLSEKRQARIFLIPYSVKDQLTARTDPANIHIEDLAAFINYLYGGEGAADTYMHMRALELFRGSLAELRSSEDVLYFAIA